MTHTQQDPRITQTQEDPRIHYNPESGNYVVYGAQGRVVCCAPRIELAQEYLLSVDDGSDERQKRREDSERRNRNQGLNSDGSFRSDRDLDSEREHRQDF